MRCAWVAGLAVILLLVPPATVLGGEPAEKPAFEVLVVGTIHAPWQFRSRAFHPGHVRAALELAEPDVIGVESNPTWFAEGRFHDVTYEAQGTAVPWAKSRDIPVYGVDWMDVEAWRKRTGERDRQRADRLEGMRRAGRFGGWVFGRIEPARLPRVEAFFDKDDFDFRLVNDIGAQAYGRRWLAGAGKRQPYGGHRNNEIVKRCVEVMQAHQGKRLVVVIGAGHKAVLDELFRRRSDVRLLEWDKDVRAPSEQEAEAALTNEDRVVILGHNLDGERSYFHRELIDLERMRSVVEALARSGGDPRVTAYFQARLHQHGGDANSAGLLLERLAAGDITGPPGEPVLYPFPLDHWRMAYDLAQAVAIERARLLLEADRRSEAGKLLHAIADARSEPGGERDARWRMLLLAKAFPSFLVRGPAAPPSTGGEGGTPMPAAWSAADPAHGSLPIRQDDDGALHLNLEHAEGAGLPYFSRRFALPSRGGTWTFSAQVRATGTERIVIEAYVWPDGRTAKTIASVEVDSREEAWRQIEVRLPVPAGQEAVLVNVYAARTAKGTLGLDDARLEPAR